MMLYITLKDIKAHSPCDYGWGRLLKTLGKTKADDEPLSFKTILESNKLYDTLWCLKALRDNDRDVRLFAVWCARQVEHLDLTGASHDTNNISERFALGNATPEELEAAREAAWEAAREAAWAAQKQEFIKRFCTEEVLS